MRRVSRILVSMKSLYSQQSRYRCLSQFLCPFTLLIETTFKGTYLPHPFKAEGARVEQGPYKFFQISSEKVPSGAFDIRKCLQYKELIQNFMIKRWDIDRWGSRN